MNIFGIDDTLNGLKRGAEKFGTRVAAAVVKKMKTRVNGFSPKEPEPYGLGMGGSDTEQMSQPAKNGGPGSGPQPGGGSSGEPGKYKGKDIKKQGDKFIVDQPMRQVGMSYDGPFDTIEEAQKSVDAEAAALEERKRRGFTNNIPHAKLRQQNKLDFLLKELPLASEAEEKRIIQAEIESLQKELSEFPPSGDPDARREKDSSTGGGRDSKLNVSESPEDLCDRCPHKRGSHGGSTCGACAAGSRSEKTHDFVLKGSPEGAHGRGELGNEDSANLGYQSAQKTTTAQADALSKCPACGYESPLGWDGKCEACGVENSEDVGGNEAKKENANSRCIKCDKSLPIEQMVQNEHGAGYLCPEDAKAWNVENSDAGTMREAIVSRYSGELQSGNIGPACKDAIVKLAEQIGSSAQQVLKDLRSDASVLSNETENGHGATCSQCNKWTDDAFMGPDGKLLCKACVSKENAVDPECACDHSNYFEASCDCEDRGCKCPECATLQAELKNAAQQFRPGDMVTVMLSDGNKEARFVKYDTNYGDGDEVVTVEVRGTISGQLFKKNEQFQEHQLRKNSLKNAAHLAPDAWEVMDCDSRRQWLIASGSDPEQADWRFSDLSEDVKKALSNEFDKMEIGAVSNGVTSRHNASPSEQEWDDNLGDFLRKNPDMDQIILTGYGDRISALNEQPKILQDAFKKYLRTNSKQNNASGQMKTFVFKDVQGEAEEIHAADEAAAWDQLAKNFATPLSDIKGMGIKLVSVRENAKSHEPCATCGLPKSMWDGVDENSFVCGNRRCSAFKNGLAPATAKKCPTCDGPVIPTEGVSGSNSQYTCKRCAHDYDSSELKNDDTAGDLEEIERHAEGIEHEIAELKVGGIQNSGLKRGLKYGSLFNAGFQIGDRVVHDTYGKGKVVSKNGAAIGVQFPGDKEALSFESKELKLA